MTNAELFKAFGYNTKEGCIICGKTPAKVEPHFGYTICEEHCNTPPINIYDEQEKFKKDNKI